MIDKLRVQQILINLISNAIKFSEKRSQVLVNVNQYHIDGETISDLCGDYLYTFRVINYGSGLSEK